MDRHAEGNPPERRLRVSEVAKLPPGWHEDGGGLSWSPTAMMASLGRPAGSCA